MKIWRSGSCGNAFFIIAKVKELLKAVDREDEIPAVMDRMWSGDYDNLCAVAYEVSHGSIEVVDDQEEADV